MTAAPDPVERCLDELLAALHGRSGDVRRVLSEAEEHLRDGVAAGLAEGLPLAQAQQRAVDRFGPPRALARRIPAPPPRLLPAPVLGQLVDSAVLLGGIGLAAIGASGLLAGGMGAAFGRAFVAGDAPGVTYTAARCAELVSYQPRAASCAQAAVAHHFGEVVGYRLAAGVLGLVVLAGWWLLSRRRPAPVVGALPEGFLATIGASLFGVAGVGLALAGAGQLTLGVGHGSGGLLSGAVVSLAVSSIFVARLARTVLLRAGVAAGRGQPVR